MKKYDAIVIGGGPAGGAAAYALKGAGKKVAIFEDDLWGGTCPNRGCDPKKMLLSAVEARDRIKQLQGNGFSKVPDADWTEMERFKETYTENIPEGTKKGLDSAGIATYYGKSSFISENQLQFDSEVFEADQFIIATGQKPSILIIEGSENLITSNEFLSLKQMPKSITFIGAGYIAMELANIANATGADVHLIHHNDRPLKAFDEDFVNDMVEQMKQSGITFHFNVYVDQVEKTSDGLTIHANDFELKTGAVVCATGRIPNVEGLNLEQAGVKVERSGIKVNEYLQTDNPNIYAVGDVIKKSEPKLTPVAGFEAKYAVGHILGQNSQPISYPAIPTLVYGSPKLAKVGISIPDAKADPEQYQVNEFDLTNWFTYHRINEPKAAAKIVLNNNKQIVGATVLTEQADELINLLTIAVDKKMDNSALNDFIFGYPTVASDLQYLF
ncbi:dihydrolipoyl dehydrogenase family protein [Companilactobacillus furfuricola]|uniref:dihydrolipoyl dehydrogenase family protein n=1 Tax=Companilactobacillus furfuricola TaxID=1462575 RepID=UPI000F768E34|nr:NAD(P)/FAD-dependent oxidoreductase [Companilactobacillus furfuricola]